MKLSVTDINSAANIYPGITSPFGSTEQNELCESIFLQPEAKNDLPVNDDITEFIDKFAKENNSDYIQESVKNLDNNNFIFDLEKEADDCSGMEIAHYRGSLNQQPELMKKVFIKYIDNPFVRNNNFQAQIKELETEREDIQGTLNILSAVLDSSNDKIKEMFAPKQKMMQEKLDSYNNFFEHLHVENN